MYPKRKINNNYPKILRKGRGKGILDVYITEDKIPKNEQNKKFITVDYNNNDDVQIDIIFNLMI